MNLPQMPRKVLIVDDDPHIRAVLRFAFEKGGFTVREAADGMEALDAVAEASPDLVVLDINMPRLDGLDVCRSLRVQGAIPILFLSSRDEEVDRIVGIEIGGDDYVVKPFSPREVVARAAGILRRVAPPEAAPAPSAATLQRHGALALDGEAWIAHFDGREVALTPTEFGLLRTLISAPGRTFGREALIDRVRGPGFAVTDRTIDSHARNLRRKFEEAGCADLVETRPGLGYRLGACTPAGS